MLKKINKTTRILLVLALLVVLAKLLVDTFWLSVWGPTNTPVSTEGLLHVERVATDSTQKISPQQLEQWHFFGEVAIEEDSPAEPVVTDAPDTRLNLELVGVFAHADEKQAAAIILEKGKTAELYRIGAKLSGSNAELTNVFADRIILLHRGKHETLRMKKPEFDDDAFVPSTTEVGRSPSVAQTRRDRRRVSPSTSVPDESVASSENAFVIPGDTREEQRDLIIKELGLEAVSADEAAGYVIGSSAPAALIGAVGLRRGDKIVSVNGQGLGEEQTDLAVLEDVMVSGAATIEVERGTRRFIVNYPP